MLVAKPLDGVPRGRSAIVPHSIHEWRASSCLGWRSNWALLRYQSLWRRWFITTVFARLPGTMAPVGLLLVGYQTQGSFAAGAQLAGVATLVSGVVGPFQGRFMDRSDLRQGLRRACLLGAASLIALAVAYRATWGMPIMLAIGVVFGISLGPISGGLRALLPLTVTTRSLDRASAVDPVVSEAAYIVGPVVAGAASALGGPMMVLAVMALCAGAAALGTARLPTRMQEPSPPRSSWTWRHTRGVYVTVFVTGAALGIVIGAVPARIEQIGMSAEVGGGLLSLMSVGSAVAGTVIKAPPMNRTSTLPRAAFLMLLLGAFLMPLTVLPSVLTIALILPLAGAPIAPLSAVGTAILQGDVPPTRLAEAFTRYASTLVLGTGAGQAFVGLTIDHTGPTVLLGLAATICLLIGARLIVLRG